MYIEATVNTTFLGFRKLSGACCAVRSMFHIRNINTFNFLCTCSFYYKYDTSFGGNSSNNGKIFTSQKKIVRTVADAQPRTSCRSYLNNLSFTFSIPVYTVINELITNQETFQIN